MTAAEITATNNALRATAEEKRAQAAAKEAAEWGATIAVEEDKAQEDGRNPDASTIALAANRIIEAATTAATAAHAAKQYARYAFEASIYANTAAAEAAEEEAHEAQVAAEAAAERADKAAASATASWMRAIHGDEL